MLLRVLLPEQSLVNTSPLSRGHCIGSLSPTALSTIPLSHLHKTTPQYLQELNYQYNPPCSLHSSSLCRLSISGFGKNTNKKCSGARPFSNSTPTIWNRLPDKLHLAKDIASFWWQLKSHLLSTLWSPHLLPLFPSPMSSFPYLSYCHTPLSCYCHTPLSPSISFTKHSKHGFFLHGVRRFSCVAFCVCVLLSFRCLVPPPPGKFVP